MFARPYWRSGKGRRPDLWAIVAIVLLASVFPVDLFPGGPHGQHGVDGQLNGKQGQVLLVHVPVKGQPADIAGRFLSRRVPFFQGASGPVGLLGIDMQDAPGTHELSVEVTDAQGSRRLSYNVLVIKEKYPVQHLTLPKDKVDLDEESLVRVKAEQEQVKTALEEVSPERFWEGGFVEPVHGTISGAFGRVRIINGQARSPHNGEDIAAPLGADVVAMNDGVARLTVDHFFSGKGVFVDHGLGLYSMYFHLLDITVQNGERVKRGQVIGKVGASGRATGPHLHWGVRLNGARVNPYSLLALSVGHPLSARQ
ncbi:MAG: M23 family metallopeptidase [Nitrospirae bacterium]|nr:MAG: M23 family metallopeptidase [Nitrospirota bacterium]